MQEQLVKCFLKMLFTFTEAAQNTTTIQTVQVFLLYLQLNKTYADCRSLHCFTFAFKFDQL